MHFYKDISLKKWNTFGLDSKARIVYKIASETELIHVLQEEDGPFFILGGGSNILLSAHIEKTILKNEIKGIIKIKETDKHSLIQVGGGENWHEFVLWCLKNGLGGVENLSLIPGTVGAAPIQNIGAYGVEIKDVFHSLDAVSLEDGTKRTFFKDECQFGYRDSIFKKELKGKFFISKVRFRLSTKEHIINSEYGAINKELEKRKITNASIKDISDAVIAIRQSKLPDPKIIGNSGSFFKNPIIPRSLYDDLLVKNPKVPHYPVDNDHVKLPAGWLIDQAGWKGKRKGDAGTYKNQALVLVNHGNASSTELIEFAKLIISDVKKKFGIQLEPEVNIIS